MKYKRNMVYLFLVSLLVFFYMYFAEIEIVSPGEGIISTGANSVDVVTPSSGFIRKFDLKAGDKIKVGDVLFSYVNLDVVYQEKSLKEIVAFLNEKKTSLKADVDSLACILSEIEKYGASFSDYNHFDALPEGKMPCDVSDKTLSAYKFAFELRSLGRKESNLRSQQEQNKNERIELNNQVTHLKSLGGLLAKSGSPRIDIIRNDAAINEIKTRIISGEISLLSLKNDVDAAKSDYARRLLETIYEISEQINAIEKDVLEKSGELELLHNKIRANSVESPVDGVVLSIENGFMEGSYVDMSRTIMVLKKDKDERLVEAKFDAKYRPFLYIGNDAKVVIDSPGFNNSYKGIISRISADSFADEKRPNVDSRYYNVEIKISNDNFLEQQHEGVQTKVFAISKKVSIMNYIGAMISSNLVFNVW